MVFHAAQVRAAQVRVVQVRAAQVRAAQVRVVQVRVTGVRRALPSHAKRRRIQYRQRDREELSRALWASQAPILSDCT
jgi:hypothetical protein